jgi:hypothetical protein
VNDLDNDAIAGKQQAPLKLMSTSFKATSELKNVMAQQIPRGPSRYY